MQKPRDNDDNPDSVEQPPGESPEERRDGDDVPEPGTDPLHEAP